MFTSDIIADCAVHLYRRLLRRRRGGGVARPQRLHTVTVSRGMLPDRGGLIGVRHRRLKTEIM